MVAGREAYREGPYKFVRYAGSTFRLGQHLHRLRDHRKRVEIPGAVIGGVVLFGLALRVPSRMELDRWVREGPFGSSWAGGVPPPLRDCIRDWASLAKLPGP
ncbi:hypothetical protein U7230_08040 [Carboxydochorda subterranea]|uniref:Uncharacterized protein n=1 Tax=Carboxydichorda subterranea TaxID=3109565 RepID=A0ABZ1BTA4_9FIRM|nr:hypothetical protein [Limnochorda sp. L945t]WRP16060.1 hypothetical protein U7230_08040 [Limnochorda sp. L945t]